MEFKFRARVKIKKAIGRILKPDGTASQAEFFEGCTGAVIRHDPVKGGYLIVLDCPEIASAMGETITAYFAEYELEALKPEPLSQGMPAESLPGPFEYPVDTAKEVLNVMASKRNRANRVSND